MHWDYGPTTMAEEIMRLKNHLPLALIIFLTILTWYRVLGQSLMGEGFFYFRNSFGPMPAEVFVKEFLSSYDAGAKLLFALFKVSFGDRVFLYQLFLLTSTMLINIFFYFLVLSLTEIGLLSLFATVLFTVNYNGFEMLAIGNYQFFVQRSLSLIFLFPSFIFFIRFLRGGSQAKKAYTVSLMLYTFSFLLFHFSLFFAIFFATYFLAFWWKERWQARVFWRKVLLLIPFALIPYVLLARGQGQSILGNVTLLSFLQQHSFSILPQILQQSVLLVVPEEIVSGLARIWSLSKWATLTRLQFPVITLVLAALWLLFWQKNKQLLTAVFASLLYLPLALFLNLYLRWELTYNLESGSRYLYVPSAISSLFMAIVIWSIFSSRPKLRQVSILLIIIFWSVLNLRSVTREFDKQAYQHEAAKKTLAYVKSIKGRFAEDSIVVLPNIIGYHGANFVQLFYGKSRTTMMPKFALDVGPLPRQFDPNKDFIIDYDYKAKTVRDVTDGYRSVIPQKPTP